jgi:hypothetical protein
MEVNLVGLCERSQREIDIESSDGDHRIEVVARHNAPGFLKEFAQSDTRFGGNERTRVFLGFGLDWPVGSEVVFQELDIPLVDPVDLIGGTDTVIETKISGVRFARRAAPLTVFGGEIPVGAPLGEMQEFLFGFPFLPSSGGRANDKEVGRVENAQPLSARTFVVQFDLNRLIIELEDAGIVLHLVYAGEFDPMTLELNGDAHLPARIASADV